MLELGPSHHLAGGPVAQWLEPIRLAMVRDQCLPIRYVHCPRRRLLSQLYTVGRLGGLMSVKNAECLDDVVPRTPQCLALDELHRTGVRSLTRAVALDPRFGPAYELRAED